MGEWRVLERFFHLHTRWFSLHGERLETDCGESLEYWRVERADSVVVLPLLDGQILLPAPVYRPGVGTSTLDFPGGRVTSDEEPVRAAQSVLQRELRIPDACIEQVRLLDERGWPVNSSFSDQRLFGAVAVLRTGTVPGQACASYAADGAGVQALVRDLECLQCRAVLREWQLSRIGSGAGARPAR